MKILAAVVTHNRRVLLARCLDALAAQTRAPDTVLVIDNASSDGTTEMLAARPVEVIRQDNLGSAGGWARAIEQALAGDYDAIWLMDDDGFPDAAALGLLERALAPGVACASSIVVREEDPERFVFPFPLLDAHGDPVLLRWPRKLARRDQLARHAPGGTYPFAHLFNGALIDLATVRAVGNVNPAWFMFGDEVDFFFRLRARGAVISVLAALHRHPDVSARPYSPIKVYYYVKNTLILNTRHMRQAWLRHGLAIGVVIARVARRNGLGPALSYVAGRNLPLLARAVARGLRGEIGKDFDG
ncbi:MAG: hypothetical protein A4S12_11830 [Proteobacteria bacterium SG_bin5]|nr:glycosyltransferase [Sphingomonas sp.]OQW39028.1 MAG: hypothetical protein A4S12_11830 [Proteobacteria bacterium SG_bin5]